MNEQAPLPYRIAAPALVRCVVSSVGLLAGRYIHLRQERVGMRLRFADGASARVYRETVLDGAPKDPCVLLVEFRLWGVQGQWGHAVFQWESLFNTPLFVGFPGFVSKLWLTNDEHGVYRGIYEWDGAERAERYARSLWRVLALGCEPSSIHYRVLPGLRRDALLAAPRLLDTAPDCDASSSWWRPVEVT